MTRAFVVGATGYTGQAVVRALRAQGAETFAHIRPDSKALGDWTKTWSALGATVDTTAWDQSAMSARLALLKPDVVFSLLGTTKKREARDKAVGQDSGYEMVDYGLSIVALRAAQAAGPHTRFVYLSSLGVSGSTTNTYLSVRWRVEEAVRASGLTHIIGRPSFITGPDRSESRPAEKVGAVVADGLLGVLAALGGRRLRDRYGSKTADTLGGALVRLALDPAARSGVYESEALL